MESEKTCELLEKCGFFKKFGNSLESACHGFVKLYCKGALMNECKRKEYRKQHGAPPDDNMLPNGFMLSSDMVPSSQTK